jgi:hypothetical protein
LGAPAQHSSGRCITTAVQTKRCHGSSKYQRVAEAVKGEIMTNPHLPKQVLNSLLLAHGGHIFRKIQELKVRDFASEAKIWENVKTHIYQIVDAIAGALAKQFTKRF